MKAELGIGYCYRKREGKGLLTIEADWKMSNNTVVLVISSFNRSFPFHSTAASLLNPVSLSVSTRHVNNKYYE